METTAPFRTQGISSRSQLPLGGTIEAHHCFHPQPQATTGIIGGLAFLTTLCKWNSFMPTFLCAA